MVVSLETSNGPCAVELSQIGFVSCPFVKDTLPPSRRINLNSGLVFFILDNAANYQTLRSVLPASWGDYTPYQEPEKPAKEAKPRKVSNRWPGKLAPRTTDPQPATTTSTKETK